MRSLCWFPLALTLLRTLVFSSLQVPRVLRSRIQSVHERANHFPPEELLLPIHTYAGSFTTKDLDLTNGQGVGHHFLCIPLSYSPFCVHSLPESVCLCLRCVCECVHVCPCVDMGMLAQLLALSAFLGIIIVRLYISHDCRGLQVDEDRLEVSWF